MADEENQQAPTVPTVAEQNPFGIHTPDEDERMEHMRLIARVAEQRVLEQLAVQHPVVAAVLSELAAHKAELAELRDKLAAKKPKKPKVEDPAPDPSADPNA